MKMRMLLGAGSLLLGAAFIIGLATPSLASVAGSAHDFTTPTSGGLSLNASNACAACHTPHNATALPDAPLSSRNASASVFTPYSSTTFQGDDTTPVSIAGLDLLCLSCHDGGQAVDTWNSTPLLTLSAGVYGFVGTNLSTTHPIGFVYADAQTGDLEGNNFPAVSPYPLYSGIMRCATCHDAHNQTAGAVKLLRTANLATFCSDCHTSK